MTVNAVAFLVSSPVGSNAIRLLTIGGAPILWIAARTTRRRPRPQVAAIVVTCLAVQTGPAVADAYIADHQPAASPAFWAPVLRFLSTHRRPVARVEVVATWGHWEAYYLAKDGVSLARGWYRQDDYPENRVLYGGDELTARAYQRWLHRLAVRYVLLPAGPLDYSAGAEAALLRSGRSGLEVVERLPNWTIFRVPRPTPILTPTSSSGAASVTQIGPAAVGIRVTRPGSFLLRVRFTPYWHTPPGVCLRPAGNGMTILDASAPGALSLTIDGSVTAMESAIAGDANACPSAPSRGG